MHCPVCKNAVLVPVTLFEQLSARRCPTCTGQWIQGEHYHLWVERHAHDLSSEDAPPQPPPHDSGPGKLCPECGRFLTRYKVGHGIDFHIDRCGGCGGIWFDANEWETLRAQKLHNHVHMIFSSAWQAEISRREREAATEKILAQLLGPDDFAEVRRIKAWLDGHAKRNELYAYLLNR